jgi:WD40 repeat protein
MSHDSFSRAERILMELADVPPAQRMAWLSKRCAGEPALMADVHALIDQFESPDDGRSLRDVTRGTPPDRLLPPGTVVDGFTIMGVLGAGSAGVAYVARQDDPARDVALKILRPSRGADARRRFELESEVLARLDHPGIACVYASRAPQHGAPAYIAMELVDGMPITDYAMLQQLDVPACLRLVALVCDAVHHAHQRGVIHRDLKPGNILVTGDGQPKVLDFGVARLVDGAGLSTSMTQVGQLVGTLPYMSPEQLAGDPADLDIRTDVYSLGVLLYHLLVRRLPFDLSELNLTEAVRAICDREPVRLASDRPDLRGDVSIVVGCAMARARERRYPSAAAMADDLRRAAAGEPIFTRRDSAWRYLRSRLRLSRLLATGAAVGLIGVAGLAAYAIVQRGEARRTAEALERQLARTTVERGRLLARMGNMAAAETLLWERANAAPEDAATHWALRELYARYTSAWETPTHTDEVRTVRFSPDDRHVLSGGRDGRVALSLARDGSPVRDWQDHAPAGVVSVGFTAGGRQVYSVGRDGRVAVRDVTSGDAVATWQLGAPGARVEDAALSVDGLLAVAWSAAGNDQPAGQVVAGPLLDGSPRVVWTAPSGVVPTSVTYSPDGRAMVVGTSDGQLVRLDGASATVRWQRGGQQSEVSRVAWSPDGRWLATGGTDRAVRIWSADTGDVRQTLTSGNGTARSVMFNADSRRVLSAGWWRVDLWDVGTGRLLRDDIGASQGWFDARFSTSGEQLVMGSAQGTVRLWELGGGMTLRPGLPTAPLSVSLDTDRAALHPVIGRSDGRITVLDPGGVPRYVRHGTRLEQVAVDGTGLQVASAGAGPMLRTWQRGVHGLVPQATLEAGDALSVAVSRDGRLTAVGETGGRVTVVSTADGRQRLTVAGDGSDALAVRIDGAGARLFIAYRSRRVAVHDLADGRELAAFESSRVPFSLAYHEGAQRLAAGTWGGTIDVWDLGAGRLMASLTGHARVVTDLDFLSADTLCSTGRDGTVRVWSITDPSELALLLQRNVGGEGVRAVDEGERLAVLFEDGHAELLDLARLDARIAGNRR